MKRSNSHRTRQEKINAATSQILQTSKLKLRSGKCIKISAFFVLVILAVQISLSYVETSTFTPDPGGMEDGSSTNAFYGLPARKEDNFKNLDILPPKPVCVKDNEGIYQMLRPLKTFVVPPIDAWELWIPNLKGCATTQFATEYMIPWYFRHQYENKTNDIYEADIIIFTGFPKCVQRHVGAARWRSVDGIRDNLYTWTIGNFSERYPSLVRRHEMKNFVFIFPSGRGATLFPSWRRHIRNATFLSPEGQFTHSHESTEPYFSDDKDIVIPGFLHDFKWFRNSSMPIEARERLLLYCGDFEKSPERKALGGLRKRIDPEKNVSFVIANKCKTATFAGSTKFCLAPPGFSPWTIRFFEVIAAGCIPVLFDHSYKLPYKHHVPYRRFAVHWPSNAINQSLVDHLLRMPAKDLKLKHEMLLQHSQKLMYTLVFRKNAYTILTKYLTHKYCTWTHGYNDTGPQMQMAL